MRDRDGIEVNQYEDGYYWCNKDGTAQLIEIIDDQVIITGSEEWQDVGEYKGKIIEEITPPIV